MRRLTIGGMMAAVPGIALGFAALRDPTELWGSGLFTLTLAVLCAATIGARSGRDARRPFLWGFAVLGWVYLIVAFAFTPWFGTPIAGFGPMRPPPLLTVKLLEFAFERLQPAPPVVVSGFLAGAVAGPATGPKILAFYQVGQSLLTLLVGLIGGVIGRRFARGGDRPSGRE